MQQSDPLDLLTSGVRPGLMTDHELHQYETLLRPLALGESNQPIPETIRRAVMDKPPIRWPVKEYLRRLQEEAEQEIAVRAQVKISRM